MWRRDNCLTFGMRVHFNLLFIQGKGEKLNVQSHFLKHTSIYLILSQTFKTYLYCMGVFECRSQIHPPSFSCFANQPFICAANDILIMEREYGTMSILHGREFTQYLEEHLWHSDRTHQCWGDYDESPFPPEMESNFLSIWDTRSQHR